MVGIGGCHVAVLGIGQNEAFSYYAVRIDIEDLLGREDLGL